MVKGEKWIPNLAIPISAISLAVAFFLCLNTDFLYFFLLFTLTSFISIIIAYYLRRFIGSLSLSIFSLILNALMVPTLWHSYYPLRLHLYPIFTILTFTLLAIASLQGNLNTSKTRTLKKERKMAFLINLALAGFFVSSLFYYRNFSCRILHYLNLIYFFPAILAFIFFLIMAIIAYFSKDCGYFLLNDNGVNIALSSFAWGLAIGYPFFLASSGTAAGCGSCFVSLLPLLFIYASITLTFGVALLSTHSICKLKMREHTL